MNKFGLAVGAAGLCLAMGGFSVTRRSMAAREREEEQLARATKITQEAAMAEQGRKAREEINELQKQTSYSFQSKIVAEQARADRERNLAKTQKILDDARTVLNHLPPSQAPVAETPAASRPAAEATPPAGLKFFDATGHAKSNGMRFRLSYPEAWTAAEGTRPHIVQKFTAPGSRDVFMVQVLPLPAGLPQDATPEDFASLYTEDFFQDFVPEGGRLISSKTTKLDGETCGMFETVQSTERAGLSIVQRSVSFVMVSKQGILVLAGASMSLPDETSAEERFAKARLQFVGIAGTLHLPDRWTRR